MVNYKNGKIYKIKSDRTEYIYIGSCSIEDLNKRLTYHKQKKNSCSSKEIIKLGGNIEIELIENYECNSKRELEEREQIIMNIFKTKYKLVNKQKSFMSVNDRKKELNKWNKNNRRLEYHNEYNKKNRDRKRELVKSNYDKNKDSINDKKKEVYFMNKYSNVMSDFVNSINEY